MGMIRDLACIARCAALLFGSAGVVLPAAASAAGVVAGSEASVGSADTTVTIAAGAEGPALLALGSPRAGGWSGAAAASLPERAWVAGREVALHWRLDAARSTLRARDADLVYVSDAPRLQASWRWRARAASGPVEHAITVRNDDASVVELPLIPSLRFDWRVDAAVPLRRFWVEKGGDMPGADGIHDDALPDGDRWQGASSTYARPLPGEPPEMIPFVLVRRDEGSQDGWYVGIEFSGRTRIALERRGASLQGEAGLDPAPGPYRTRLGPGAAFETPTVFVGASRNGIDGAGNAVRRWVRAVLVNPRSWANPSFPWTVSNSWGSGMEVDAALARRMIDDASSLGIEMYHLDAGWFRAVGDWHPDPARFPDGVAAIADYAHRRGLKFGLWVDWTQAGVATGPGALTVSDPVVRDWLVADPPAGWAHSEPFKGITVDIGVPAAREWAARETERIVVQNHLDMLEHDGYLVAQGSSRDGHPAEAPLPGTLRVYEDSGYLWASGSNDTDVSYHATRAYYDIQRRLRSRHPELLLEVCNDGGRMVDFGSAAHGDYFSITDHYDPLSNRRAFHDASHLLPPAMLESYVERWPVHDLDNLRYMLRSGMMGWFSLMLDASRLDAGQRAAVRAEVTLYKQLLRPLIREADLYHVSARPDGIHWDGIEYYAPGRRRGVLYAFRGSGDEEPVHRFALRGLDPARRYRIVFHDRGSSSGTVVAGSTLLRDGVEISLLNPLSSELVFIDAVR